MSLSPLDLTLITARELGGNLVRSGLTALGIFMGVAAVNATLNVSAITRAQIQEKLAARDNPFVMPYFAPNEGFTSYQRPKVDDEDINVLQQAAPGILGISTVSYIGAFSSIQYHGQKVTGTRVLGVSDNYQKTTGRKILQGRFFETADFEQYQPVAIIDEVLVNQLFQGESPLGKGVYAGGTRFTIVGVTATKTQYADQDPRGEFWVTQTYGNALSGGWSYSATQIALRRLNEYQAVQDQVEEILMQRYPNFRVYVYGNAEDLYLEDQQQRTSSMILNIVGLLALVIGGVGIANITVASVVERTREIGLRRAVGATDIEVMLQFIIEVVLLSVLSGMAAVATVHFLTQAATTRLFVAPYEFRLRDASISMGAALAVGIGASFFPALRVTRIDVVQALRGE
ncbi:MAG: ABC transporter permease [Leptolyngbyaceae cyanobacterium MO_188.B28]|nr:ABC transporter permease [Leptolyngbyaceae cyanobacterium MO_188.B28]